MELIDRYLTTIDKKEFWIADNDKQVSSVKILNIQARPSSIYLNKHDIQIYIEQWVLDEMECYATKWKQNAPTVVFHRKNHTVCSYENLHFQRHEKKENGIVIMHFTGEMFEWN